MHHGPSIPVFFCPEQVTPRSAVVASPSAAKPGPVVDSWRSLGLPISVHGFAPATVDDLCLAHDRRYVEAVLSQREENGFGNTSYVVARSLPYTTGSFMAAALHAFRTGGAAASPTSGFHHAGHAHGAGFCTFNGLAVAAIKLLKAGASKVGILDLDAHFGDGTTEILARTPGLADRVRHFTRGMPPYSGGRENVPAFLAHLPRLLEQWKSLGVETVLYQAGADPHVDDRVGCRFNTTLELLERDRAVFQACAHLGLPIAWNLAGGYQEDSRLDWPQAIRPLLEIHDNTMRACVEAFAR